MKQYLFVGLLILLGGFVQAQPAKFIVPQDYVLNEPGDYEIYERDIILFANWFEGTSLDHGFDKREKSIEFFDKWMAGNPKFQIPVDSSIVTFWEKNPLLVTAYRAGWARMLIKSPERLDDKVSGNLAGLISAMNLYKLGGVKKDKEMEKLIKLVKKNQLSTWVGDQLKASGQ